MTNISGGALHMDMALDSNGPHNLRKSDVNRESIRTQHVLQVEIYRTNIKKKNRAFIVNTIVPFLLLCVNVVGFGPIKQPAQYQNTILGYGHHSGP